MKPLKCIAINPPWHKEYYLSFPLGLATIAHIVKLQGHLMEIIDLDAEKIEGKDISTRLVIAPYIPDVVLLTGMITNVKNVSQIAKDVKTVWPGSTVILGGSLATSAPNSILRLLNVDIFVIGEGDESIVRILDRISSSKSLEDIPGIKIKNEGRIFDNTNNFLAPDITKTPRPFYEGFPMELYIDYLNQSGYCFELYASKGCSFNCSFCYRISGSRVRYRDVGNVISEIEFVKKRYGIDRFSFVDDCFALNRKWIYEFCKKVSPLRIRFRGQTSVNAVNEELLIRMKHAGLFGISVGVESGSSTMLKEMKKDINLRRADKLLSIASSLGIQYNATFIIGMPGETDESIGMTKDFLIRNLFTDNFQIFFLSPYPGTEIYNDLIVKGIIKNEVNYIYNLGLLDMVNINLTGESNEKLINWREYILKEVARHSNQGHNTNPGAYWKIKTNSQTTKNDNEENNIQKRGGLK